MTKVTDDDVHELAARHGVDTRSLEFHTVPDQDAALRHDLKRIGTSPFLPADLPVGGAIYDVRTGKLMPVEMWAGREKDARPAEFGDTAH
jgi:carbonic anhydrase